MSVLARGVSAAVQVCGCGTWVAMGLLRCPRCQTITPLFAGRIKEERMPRITVASGPSNAAAVPGETGYIQPAAPEAPETPEVEIRAEHGPELENLPDSVRVELHVKPDPEAFVAEVRKQVRVRKPPTRSTGAEA